MGDFLGIAEEEKAFAVLIMLAIFVPKEREYVVVIIYAIKAEPIPKVFGQEGLNFDCVISAGTEADETGDEQIGESRMVVVAAALFFAFEPLTGRFVEVFADVGFAIEMLGVNVSEKGIEIVARGDQFLRVIAKNVSESDKGLGCGQWPDRAVPLAFAAAVRAKFEVAALSGCDAERRAKALRIGELRPGIFMACVG